MTRTEQERLAVVETKVNHIESDVNEIKNDVKTLLLNNSNTKGKISVWDRILQLLAAAVMGGAMGRLWK